MLKREPLIKWHWRRWLMTLRIVLFPALLFTAGTIQAARSEGSADLLRIMRVVDSLKQLGHLSEVSVLLDSAEVMARYHGDATVLGRVMLEKAALLETRGESGRALSMLYEAMQEVQRSGDSLSMAEVLNSIGTIQHNQKNFDKAEAYYNRSGAIYQRLGLKQKTGKYWNNMGSLYEDMGDPAHALSFHRRSLGIWQELGNTGWAAVSYMHMGTCYGLLGKTDSAKYFLEQSMHDQDADSKGYLMAITKVNYGVNENRAGRQHVALRYCKEGLAIAMNLQARLLESEACDCLYKTYDAMGDKGLALEYYRRAVELRDALFGEAKVKNMTRIEMDHDFEQKQLADSLTRAKRQVEEEMLHQAEVAKEREGRNIALFTSFAVLLLAGALWSRLRFMRLSKGRIQRERERSERLLLNILPTSVAQELKDNGKALAREYAGATILFSDFKDFTRISLSMNAQALVEELDHCFKAFDRIMVAHDIEKIKTIGDAYMCVGGLPDLAPATPANVVHAALEMQEFVAQRKAQREAKGLVAFTMRVGIHTGPVVAGVVGLKKFAFDIWGDAVNTANAMERAGEAGKVNISEATYLLVRNEPGLAFTGRGKVEAKSKGVMEMYFVSHASVSPSASTA
ncbi:MAG: tetratricopeptide repeat protein [Flavobacteriales bacterium]|nr:tetratricopeptide repeat protein [Flavobacteriales bacterium]